MADATNETEEKISEDKTTCAPEIVYPKLYDIADRCAVKEQRKFYFGLFFQLLLLFLAVVMALINDETPIHAAMLSLLLLVLFSVSAYLSYSKTVDRWYAARALAESIKTRSWRYMMKAVPYDAADEEAELHFAQDVNGLVDKHIELLGSRLRNKPAVQVTPQMKAFRALNREERGNFYRECRVQDQCDWYRRKARAKAVQGRIFSGLFLVAVLVALVIALLRIWTPSNSIWPIDAIISIATAILTWIQSKKFTELKSTYEHAAGEISHILEGWPKNPSEEDLIRSVADTESVFSQEHTRWAARKDI